MSSEKHPTTYVEIEGTHGTALTISVGGASASVLKNPEKIRQIMEILELPEGTTARIISVAGDVIVR